MNIRPIKSEADYERALAEVAALVEKNPIADSEDADRLEILAALVAKYEDSHFSIGKPTPVEAILFRMDQQGLTRKDLIPYIGSASKVSEVLNGKRPLSMSMIRALRDKLGIPADALISEADDKGAASEDLLQVYPLKQMCELGYFGRSKSSYVEIRKDPKKAINALFSKAKINQSSLAYCRSTAHSNNGKQLNQRALRAWQARVSLKSLDRSVANYRKDTINRDFLDEIAQLSVLEKGPATAREMLEKHGIPVVFEHHLEHTYLDGACFLRFDGVPVIGLTIRHDKLDNFWFTLMHELVHVGWHLGAKNSSFFDDLDAPVTDDNLEKEADELAAEALIPNDVWNDSNIVSAEDWKDVVQFAQSIRRHPAVVAGRIQRTTGNYKHFHRLIGRNAVRGLFKFR